MKKSALQTPSIQSLDRGLFRLEGAAKSSDPVSLGHLTNLLGIDRSSVFRLANILRRRGFLANPAGRKDYIRGPSIWRLSRSHDWSDMLITFSHKHVKKLAIRTGETTHLAVRERKQAFFIDHYAATRQLIVVSGQVGEFVPLDCTAHGKALLADFGPDELARKCARVKAAGYAIDQEEYVEGARCLAAPVRDRDGAVVAVGHFYSGRAIPAARPTSAADPAARRNLRLAKGVGPMRRRHA